MESVNIIEAILEGNLAAVQGHILAHENLEVINDKGESALYLAARNGHFEVVRYLVDIGININTVTLNGRC